MAIPRPSPLYGDDISTWRAPRPQWGSAWAGQPRAPHSRKGEEGQDHGSLPTPGFHGSWTSVQSPHQEDISPPWGTGPLSWGCFEAAQRLSRGI